MTEKQYWKALSKAEKLINVEPGTLKGFYLDRLIKKLEKFESMHPQNGRYSDVRKRLEIEHNAMEYVDGEGIDACYCFQNSNTKCILLDFEWADGVTCIEAYVFFKVAKEHNNHMTKELIVDNSY